MHSKLSKWTALVLASAAPLSSANPEPPRVASQPAAAAPSLADAVVRLRRSAVALRITPDGGPDAPGDATPIRSQVIVSGFVLDRDGYVLTVGDEIQHGTIAVELDGGALYLGRVVGADATTNVGVVHIEGATVEPVTAAPKDAARAGIVVFGIGNPYGLSASVAVGHVTGAGRRVECGGFLWTDLLQVSLPINPGDQGGPVADQEGRVLGMLLTRYRPGPPAPNEGGDVEPQGIAFALPIAAAEEIARGLIAEDGVRPHAAGTPWLGVRAFDIQDPILREHLRLESDAGVLIEAVFEDSPASKVGIEKNDVLVGFGGARVLGAQHLGQLVRSTTVAQRVELEVIRAGAKKSFELTIGARP